VCRGNQDSRNIESSKNRSAIAGGGEPVVKIYRD